ncbi:MAG: tetratricopeptide repeat protein [Leptolyngbyaceae cyanobacterium CSU_1_3]|nr:tetratricopeptide repeat protein [Leptolyngbyaceae cyanobacterium CSU_1_3]
MASAYLLKSRETGDFSNIVKAESALDQSLHLEPDNQFDNQFGNQSGNGEALKLQLILLLTEHRFREGLDLAEQLQSRFPNDSQIETALIDAHVELGNYQAAIATADALISSCPSAPVYARRSYLRSLHGNSSAAIADMQKAIKTANPRDHEGLAWYNVHLGIELLNAGHWAAGEQAIDQALEVFPNYPIALSAKARARLSDQDWQQAVHYYQRSQMQMPLPDTAMALGDLHKHLGDRDAAERQYDLVDFLVRSGGEPFEKAYAHQLVLFWADQEQHLDQALNLIEQEKMTRSDIYTYDALAWCLFKLGRRSQAKEAIDQALQLHTLDARIYYHAGQIYHSQGEDKKAIQFLKQALKINPVFHPLQADLARQVLASLGEQLDF